MDNIKWKCTWKLLVKNQEQRYFFISQNQALKYTFLLIKIIIVYIKFKQDVKLLVKLNW